jgi:hypothetical protein
MRKRVNSSLLVGLMTLLSVLPNARKGEMKDVTKPHLGFYQCTEAKLDARDLSSYFDKIDLELRADETFVLHYCEKNGNSRTETGRYQYDREKGTITLFGAGLQKSFPLQKGVLIVTVSIGKETLTLKFEQK